VGPNVGGIEGIGYVRARGARDASARTSTRIPMKIGPNATKYLPPVGLDAAASYVPTVMRIPTTRRIVPAMIPFRRAVDDLRVVMPPGGNGPGKPPGATGGGPAGGEATPGGVDDTESGGA
jgi:hypothetical protein